MTKKDKEKEILFGVFKKEVIEKGLVEDETPDFIVTDPVNSEKLGIEITTIYTGEASAICRDDRFLDKFIDNNKDGASRKKNGPEYLKRLKVAKVEGDISLVHKDHIVWQIQTPGDHFSFFEKLVQQKSPAYKEKVKDLVFVDLIAIDEDNFFKPSKAEVGKYYGLMRQHSFFDTVISSNFQEIFLVSEFDSGKYSLPLKWLIFKSEYEVFKKFWKELNHKCKDELKLLLDNFCVCLIHMGFKNIYLSNDAKYRYLFFGNCYWKIDKLTSEIEEIQFLVVKLPEENKAENILKNHEKYKELFKKYMKYRQDIIPVFVEGMFPKLP